MDRRHADEKARKEHEATQLQNRQEREFKESLDRHYQERLDYYRLTRPGLPKADFDRDLAKATLSVRSRRRGLGGPGEARAVCLCLLAKPRHNIRDL